MLFAVIITVIIVRGGNILARDIPNESRSLIIMGVEFHHLFTGFLFVHISQIILVYFNYSNSFRTIYVIGTALIADQITYIMIVPLNDEAFFSSFSFVGAIICISWLLFRLVTLIKKSN